MSLRPYELHTFYTTPGQSATLISAMAHNGLVTTFLLARNGRFAAFFRESRATRPVPGEKTE